MTLFAMLVALSASPWQSLHAETLIVDGINVDTGQSVRGLSSSSVRAKWGEPLTKRGAVGDPPISRWEYSNYVVFFEYDHVIHAVQKR